MTPLVAVLTAATMLACTIYFAADAMYRRTRDWRWDDRAHFAWWTGAFGAVLTVVV